MLHVETVEDLERPELVPYRTMRQQAEHHRGGVFVAEGEKVVRRLLESDLTVISVLMPRKWLEVFEPLLRARPEEIRAYIAEKPLLEHMTGFSFYQGVLGLAKVPPNVALEAALPRCPRPWFLAAVDGVSSAENLGGLVRNCVAFGVQTLIIGESSGSPYIRRAVRSSMGTVFLVPVVEVPNLAATLGELRARGVRCVAAHPHTDRRAIADAEFGSDCCLVFGSEGQGISPSVLSACDEAVAIPMHPGVDSLNVGSAAAVFLYEVVRQRGRAGGNRLARPGSGGWA